MTPLGQVKLSFSEDLKSIEELKQLNLTSISNNQVFKVLYSTKVGANENAEDDNKSGKNSKKPELKHW